MISPGCIVRVYRHGDVVWVVHPLVAKPFEAVDTLHLAAGNQITLADPGRTDMKHERSDLQMDDKEFFEMQLKTLFPSASGWPAEYVHQRALLGVVNEATTLARAAEREFRKLDENRDLTPEARKRKRTELANLYIGKLETSQTFIRAKEAAESALARYAANINSVLKPATDAQSVGLHAQIRAQLLAMKDPKERLNFLARHGNDGTLLSAALTAPPFVSGLSDGEVALLRSNLERQADPAIIKERDFVTSALAEIERGYRAARSRIATRGGLEKESLGQAAYGAAA